MISFSTRLVLLFLSLSLVGCSTPLWEINVNESVNSAGVASHGVCRRPCLSGGARAKTVEKADAVQIVHKRVIYYVGDVVSEGDVRDTQEKLVSYEVSPNKATFEEGQIVKITRDGDKVKFSNP